MSTEAETWLEATYPELLKDWKEAYLRPINKSQTINQSIIKDCRICSIRPNTGLHYGMHTCEADKQFLKRTFHERQTYKICHLYCPPRLRGWCQYCRLRFSLRTGINLKMIRIGEKKKKSPRSSKSKAANKAGTVPIKIELESPDAHFRREAALKLHNSSLKDVEHIQEVASTMYNPFRPYLDTDQILSKKRTVPSVDAAMNSHNPLAFYQQQLSYNYWNHLQYSMQGFSHIGSPEVCPELECYRDLSMSPCQILPPGYHDQSTSPPQVPPPGYRDQSTSPCQMFPSDYRDHSTSPCQVLPLDLSSSSSSSSSSSVSKTPSRSPSQPPSRPSSAGSLTSIPSPRSCQVSDMGHSFNKLSVNSAVLQEALCMVHSTLSPGRFQNLSSVSDVLSE